MSGEVELTEALIRLHRKPVVNIVCKVTAVNGKLCNAQPIDGGAEILNVRLSPVINESTEGFFIEPEMDSDIMVSLVKINESESKGFATAFSRIKSIRMITTSGTVYSSVKAESLVEQMGKLTDYVSTFKTAVVTAINGVAPGSGSAINTALAGKTTGEFGNNIKNENVKHA